MYHSNKALHVEVLIDNSFGRRTILSVLDVDLDDDHIRFWWDFDNSGPRSKNNIIEDVVILENFLYVLKQGVCVCLFI